MSSLDFNIAQLRHAYSLLINGHVKDTCQFAVGLIGPIVRDLETMRDSDGSGEAGETRSGSTEGDSADPKGIARNPLISENTHDASN